MTPASSLRARPPEGRDTLRLRRTAAGPPDRHRLPRRPGGGRAAAAGRADDRGPDYGCRIYPGCYGTGDYLAGPDAARLADLHAALADAEVAAIRAIRGGHGCMGIVDRIDTALLRCQPKLMIGYSDLEALQALWARENAPTLHAPMAASVILLPESRKDRDAPARCRWAGPASASCRQAQRITPAPNRPISPITIR